ncbi:MAG: hypothetical protein ACSHWY_12325, partial [Octadecabacter sp.]
MADYVIPAPQVHAIPTQAGRAFPVRRVYCVGRIYAADLISLGLIVPPFLMCQSGHRRQIVSKIVCYLDFVITGSAVLLMSSVSGHGCICFVLFPYKRARGAALNPCSNALIQTALMAVCRIWSASPCAICSTVSSANNALARPRGPNQPKNMRVIIDASVPINEMKIASG